MGLQIVELLMEVEETFDVEITDAEAASFQTVGALYDFLLARLSTADPAMPGQGEHTKCLSSHAFYRLRRALVAQCGVAREAVTLDCPLDDLLPPSERRRCWRRLGRSLDWRLPRLERPAALRIGLMLLTGILLAAALAATFLDVPLEYAVGLFIAGVLTPIDGAWLTLPWKRCFPPDCVTVRDLVQRLLQLNYGAIAAECRQYLPEDIWKMLTGLVARELRIPADAVTADARLYDLCG